MVIECLPCNTSIVWSSSGSSPPVTSSGNHRVPGECQSQSRVPGSTVEPLQQSVTLQSEQLDPRYLSSSASLYARLAFKTDQCGILRDGKMFTPGGRYGCHRRSEPRSSRARNRPNPQERSRLGRHRSLRWDARAVGPFEVHESVSHLARKATILLCNSPSQIGSSKSFGFLS